MSEDSERYELGIYWRHECTHPSLSGLMGHRERSLEGSHKNFEKALPARAQWPIKIIQPPLLGMQRALLGTNVPLTGYGFDLNGDGTATGCFTGDAPFMVVRSQRPDIRRVQELVDENAPGVGDDHTSANPRVVAYRNQGWQLALGHLAPDLRYAVYEAAEDKPEWAGEATVYVATPDGSWALGEYTPAGGPYETRHNGHLDLCVEIGAAWDAWAEAGSPGRDQLDVTVNDCGTHVWVDGPTGLLDPRRRGWRRHRDSPRPR